MTEIHKLKKEEIFNLLRTSESGLTDEEAKKRLLEFGQNEIKEIKKIPIYKRFFKQFTQFFALILWAGAFLAFLSDNIQPGTGMFKLGIAIILVIVINAVFTFILEYKAEKTIEKLKLLLPFKIKVIRNGVEKEIDARWIVPGDLIILTEGDKVPADSRIIESFNIKVNNASITGESEPIWLEHNPCEKEINKCKNVAFASATVLSGYGKAIVFATGMNTEFGKITQLTSSVERQLTPLQKEIDKASRLIASIALFVGIIFFWIGSFFTEKTFWENFIFTIGIIVALVPEGMLPTITLSLAMGSQRMAKKNALIKTLTSVETLGSVTVICTDKTGTITQNKMVVKELWTMDKEKSSIDLLTKAAYLCNNARYVDGIYKGDPTEVGLLKYTRTKLGEIKAKRIYEIPFDPERKRMTTVNALDNHQIVFTKGAMETVFPLCSHILVNGKKIALDESYIEDIKNVYNSLTEKGLRVIAFSFKHSKDMIINENIYSSDLEKNMTFLGLIGLEDPPRPEVFQAIKKCSKAGIKVIMITGDNARTALSTAREIGLIKSDNPILIEDKEFIKLSDDDLRRKLIEKEIIFARMTPRHKLRIVSILKQMGERIAVTGDGINDAPALKKADIGIAMGSGTDVAKEASDMVLLDDNFATIVNAIEEGRTIYENIRKFITYFFTSNVAELIPYVIYAIFKVPLPLTVMQILAVDLGTDIFPGLALGAEKPTKDVMNLPPRSPTERIFNTDVLITSFLFFGPIEAAAGLFGFFSVLNQANWKWGGSISAESITYIQATTACLTGIVVTQIGNVFSCRSFRKTIFELGIFSNPFIIWAIVLELLIQIFIVYTSIGNKIFSTYPIPLSIWIQLIPFAVFLIFTGELRKLLRKKK